MAVSAGQVSASDGPLTEGIGAVVSAAIAVSPAITDAGLARRVPCAATSVASSVKGAPEASSSNVSTTTAVRYVARAGVTMARQRVMRKRGQDSS